jgi:hypothetical protein
MEDKAALFPVIVSLLSWLVAKAWRVREGRKGEETENGEWVSKPCFQQTEKICMPCPPREKTSVAAY